MNLLLMKNGVLKVKDETIAFQEIDTPQKNYPIEVISNIYAFADISLTFDVLKELKSHKINLFLYNPISKDYMELLNNHNYQGKTLVNQVRCYLDEDTKLYIVKQIVDSEIANLSYSLLSYRNLDVDLKFYRRLRNHIKEATNKDLIMLYEALAMKRYYEYLNKSVIDYGFFIPFRHAYKPHDPMNKMITYLNGVLYNEILSYIIECGLNPSIGYNHASNDRKYTLQLDIADIYKAIIVEKAILTLAHNKTIQPDDFEKSEGIPKDVKTKLIVAFHERLKSTIFYNNKHMTYQDIIKQDIYKLRNYVNGKSSKLSFYKTRF